MGSWLGSLPPPPLSSAPQRGDPKRLPESPQGAVILFQPLAQGYDSIVTQVVVAEVQALQVLVHGDHAGQILAAVPGEPALHQPARDTGNPRPQWGGLAQEQYSGTLGTAAFIFSYEAVLDKGSLPPD